MPELKTKLTTVSVDDFLDTIKSEQVRDDCRTIAGIMQKAAKAPPRMWGSSIVGFGTRRYRYANGKEAEFMLTAFSPRKQNITLYLGGLEAHSDLLARLGTHSCGKGCLYIKRLSDVHMPTLTKLVKASVADMRKAHSSCVVIGRLTARTSPSRPGRIRRAWDSNGWYSSRDKAPRSEEHTS